MLTDLVDLEPLLDQYDPEILLVGPLLGLPMSSGYRYFHIAGKGIRKYHALGLGFVDSETDAERQRADVIQKLKARFAQVATFISHLEMARAVHARWPSEETARVLSSAEIATQAAPAEFSEHQTAIEASTEGVPTGSKRAVDSLARGLLGQDRPIENLGSAHFGAPEPNWHSRLAQDSAAVTREPTAPESAVQGTTRRNNRATGSTNPDDQFASGLVHELSRPRSPDQNAKPAPAIDQTTTAHMSPHRRSSIGPTTNPEPATIGNREAANDGGKTGQASQHQDQIFDKLARELAAHTSGDNKPPTRLPAVAKLPPLPPRRSEPADRQWQPDFGLCEDDFACAVLKLKATLEPKSLLNSPIEPFHNQPGGTVIASIGRTPGRTSTIVHSAALTAAILLIAMLVLPEEANSPQEGQTTRSQVASLPAAPTSETPVSDVVGTARTAEKASPATPGIMPSSPAAQRSTPTNILTDVAPVTNQALTTAALSAEASVPTALPLVAKSSNAINAAAASSQQSAAPNDPVAADRPDTEAIARLVDRGLQSLKRGDLVSARLSLQHAAEAVPDSAAPPSTGHDVNDAAQVQASPSIGPVADQPSPAAPSGQTTSALARELVSGTAQTSTSEVATRHSAPTPVARSAITASKPQAPLHLNHDEITTLLKQGTDFLRDGDFASARLVLHRAAEAGSAEAALALGSTYDPLVLRQLRAVGIAPDVAQARQWYQKAAVLGASAAQLSLAKLAESGQ